MNALIWQLELFSLYVLLVGIFYGIYAASSEVRLDIKRMFPLHARWFGITFYGVMAWFCYSIPVTAIEAVGLGEWRVGALIGIATYIWIVIGTMQTFIVFADSETGVITTDTLDVREKPAHETEEDDIKNNIPSQYQVHLTGYTFKMPHWRVDRSDERDPDVPLDLQSIPLDLEFETNANAADAEAMGGEKVKMKGELLFIYDLKRPAGLIRAKRQDEIMKSSKTYIAGILQPIVASFHATHGFNKTDLDNLNADVRAKLEYLGISKSEQQGEAAPRTIRKKESDTEFEKQYAIIVQNVIIKLDREKSHQDNLELQADAQRIFKNAGGEMTYEQALERAQINRKIATLSIQRIVKESKITGQGGMAVAQYIENALGKGGEDVTKSSPSGGRGKGGDKNKGNK